MIWLRYHQFQTASYFLTNFGKRMNKQDWITETPILQWAVWHARGNKKAVCIAGGTQRQIDRHFGTAWGLYPDLILATRSRWGAHVVRCCISLFLFFLLSLKFEITVEQRIIPTVVADDFNLKLLLVQV